MGTGASSYEPGLVNIASQTGLLGPTYIITYDVYYVVPDRRNYRPRAYDRPWFFKDAYACNEKNASDLLIPREIIRSLDIALLAFNPVIAEIPGR